MSQLGNGLEGRTSTLTLNQNRRERGEIKRLENKKESRGRAWLDEKKKGEPRRLGLKKLKLTTGLER